MSSIRLQRLFGTIGAASILTGAPVCLHAQDGQGWQSQTARRAADADTEDVGSKTAYAFKSRTDSMSWARNRALARRATGFRLVVSLQDRHLALCDDSGLPAVNADDEDVLSLRQAKHGQRCHPQSTNNQAAQ